MTLYLQVQFFKLDCTENARITTNNALKSERKENVPSPEKV